MPRPTCACAITDGLPSTSAYETFWLGKALSAWMSAQPMRWVKLILPPRVRDMWLLMTMRLSIISLAGMVRTLVAVGTVSESSMFAARVFGMPRSGVTTSSRCSTSAAGVVGACAGTGCAAAGRAVVRATGCEPTVGTGAVTGCAAAAGCAGAGCAGAVPAGCAGADPAGWEAPPFT